jgi:sensor histidine kinase YesM
MVRIKKPLGLKKKNLSIGTRLILLFIITSAIIFFVNMFTYINVNKAMESIGGVYISNAELNKLTDVLSSVQRHMYEFLDTRSSDALKNYYQSAENYRNLIEQLNDEISDDNVKLMERKIRNMSDNYLDLTYKAIQAKRGRNVSKYTENFSAAKELYEYIKLNIFSLNNQQFKDNSKIYELNLASLKYIEVIGVSIIILVSVINVLLIIIMTKNITNPLRRLAVAANQVAGGNFSIELKESDNNDEIDVVSKAFNKMTISINEYINQIKENMEYESRLKENELLMKNHLKDAQLKYLQAQINPHFLFNTLNAGVQLAMMEGAEKTSVFMEKTAEFYRYNTKKLNEDARLEEEIEIVHNYIYIMNVRLAREINFTEDIDRELMDIRLPSMILQPIIENALSYGISDIEWEGKIILSIYRQDDKIQISIKDNGKGIEEDIIKDILNENSIGEHQTKTTSGIGLKNVISRLKLYYGREDVISIISKGANTGTEVTLHIPYQEMDEE